MIYFARKLERKGIKIASLEMKHGIKFHKWFATLFIAGLAIYNLCATKKKVLLLYSYVRYQLTTIKNIHIYLYMYNIYIQTLLLV